MVFKRKSDEFGLLEIAQVDERVGVFREEDLEEAIRDAVLRVPLTKKGVEALGEAARVGGAKLRSASMRRALLPDWHAFEGKKINEGTSIENSPSSRCLAFLSSYPDIPSEITALAPPEHLAFIVEKGKLAPSARAAASKRLVSKMEHAKNDSDDEQLRNFVRSSFEAAWLGKWDAEERENIVSKALSCDKDMKSSAFYISRGGECADRGEFYIKIAEEGNADACVDVLERAVEDGWSRTVLDAILDSDDYIAMGRAIAYLDEGDEKQEIVSFLASTDPDGRGCAFALRCAFLSENDEEMLVDRLEEVGFAEPLVEAGLYAPLSEGSLLRIFRVIPEADPTGHSMVDAVETLFPSKIDDRLHLIAGALSEMKPGIWSFASPQMSRLGILLRDGLYSLLDKMNKIEKIGEPERNGETEDMENAEPSPPRFSEPHPWLVEWSKIVFSTRWTDIEKLDGGKIPDEERQKEYAEKIAFVTMCFDDGPDGFPVL